MSAQEPNVPYGTTAERLRAFALNEETRARIGLLASRYWEHAAYGFLFISAVILRFWNLGERAMHHDESLHGYFSFQFTEGLRHIFTFGNAGANTTYYHEPFMHGPFQFIGSGFLMFVFGDGEYQARLLAAILGTAMVLMPWLLRKQIGVFGALATSAFICFSPTLTYFSRFTREDIYTAFWTLGIVIFAWRYIASRENKWLFLTAAFMAGSFATKETTFLTVAGFLIFFNILFAMQIADKMRAKSPMDTPRYAATVFGLSFVAWIIAIAWPFIDDWRRKYDLTEIPPHAVLVVILGTLAIPQYAAAVQLLPFFGDHGAGAGVCANLSWRNCAYEGGHFNVAPPEFTIAVVSVLGLFGIAAAIGLSWNPKLWLMAAAAYWIPYFLLFSTFGTNYASSDFLGMSGVYNPFTGMMSGLWGSMDYWFSQQDVRRGGQPDYYYVITLPVYEFLTLGLSIAATAFFFIRGKLLHAAIVGAGLLAIFALLQMPAGPDVEHVSVVHMLIPIALILLAVLAFPMDGLTRFLLYWFVITFAGLSIAGEKMPWLNVHMALPLALIAGRFVGYIVEQTDLRHDLPKLERVAPFAYVAVASALAVTVFVIVGPFSLASVGGWVLALVAAGSVYWAYTGYSRRTAAQVAVVGLVAAFTIFSLRATVLASWGHPDNPYVGNPGDVATRDYGEVPVEILVYTQTSGDVPIIQRQIDEAARTSGLGYALPIVVDSSDGFTWPWAWYLRDYDSVSYQELRSDSQLDTTNQPIILASRDAAASLQLGEGYAEGVPYHHRRWFPEEYRKGANYSMSDFWGDVVTPGTWGDWLDFWVRKTLPASQPGTVDGVAFFPTAYEGLPQAPVGPTVRTEGTQLVVGGRGAAPGQLNLPSDVAFDAAGNIYVADTDNNRISKYDANGQFLDRIGGLGQSDVFLRQPWSMTVSEDGTVFVADTWNHRIVKLNSGLEVVDEWGGGGQVEAGGDPFLLFGPREIALTAEGNLLVADTGNSRIIEYTQDGDLVRQFGGPATSSEEIQLAEPVGIVAAENGDIYIADFWNSRILVLDSNLSEKQEIAVPSWGSQAVTDRPYMALLPDGGLLATDPASGDVLIFDSEGNQTGTYEVPAEQGQAAVRPIGVAVDGSESVLIADSIGHVVRKIPLTEVLGE